MDYAPLQKIFPCSQEGSQALWRFDSIELEVGD